MNHRKLDQLNCIRGAKNIFPEKAANPAKNESFRIPKSRKTRKPDYHHRLSWCGVNSPRIKWPGDPWEALSLALRTTTSTK